MNELGIDFDVARRMSNDISGLTNQSNKMKANFKVVKSKIDDMPPGFILTTSGIEDEIDKLFGKIEEGINNAASTFDVCVDNYYNVEQKDATQRKTVLQQIKAENRFYWAYPKASGTMHVLSSEKLGELFTKYGAKQNGNTYTFIMDGKEYKYNTLNHRLSCGNGETVDVVFLGSNNIKFDDIKNTITFLSGSGEKVTGSVHNVEGQGLSNNSLAIVPYNSSYDNGDMSKAPDAVIASTLTGEYLAGGGKKNIYNSLIGYSQGAQAAFRAVASSNSKVYNSIVAVNGSAYWGGDSPVNLITRGNGNYDPLKNMEIIFMESKDNKDWNRTIKKTIDDLLSNGVSKNKISFFTNDNDLVNYLNSLGMAHTDISGIYSGHGCGWNMIYDSNVIDYLSKKS